MILHTHVHLKGLVFTYGIITLGWTKPNKQGTFDAKQATDTKKPKYTCFAIDNFASKNKCFVTQSNFTSCLRETRIYQP